MSTLIFTSSVGSSIKSNDNKPDEDGYYTQNFGTIGVANTSGIVYEITGEVRDLFADDSPLLKRLGSGYLRSEQGHPKKLPGMTNVDYINRILKIEEKSICGHIKEIQIMENLQGPGTFTIVGKIRPAGPYASSLKDDLENPNSNTAFSIRSLVDQRIENGVIIRTLRTIVTWDFVDSPGISTANKLNSVGLEEDLIEIDTTDTDEVNSIVASLEDMGDVGTENDIGIRKEVLKELSLCKGNNCIYRDWK